MRKSQLGSAFGFVRPLSLGGRSRSKIELCSKRVVLMGASFSTLVCRFAKNVASRVRQNHSNEQPSFAIAH